MKNHPRIAITRIIHPDVVKDVFKKSNEQIQEKFIAYEKKWIAESIRMEFDFTKKKPKKGSEIEYNIEYMSDGSMKIEGWQCVKQNIAF